MLHFSLPHICCSCHYWGSGLKVLLTWSFQTRQTRGLIGLECWDRLQLPVAAQSFIFSSESCIVCMQEYILTLVRACPLLFVDSCKSTDVIPIPPFSFFGSSITCMFLTVQCFHSTRNKQTVLLLFWYHYYICLIIQTFTKFHGVLVNYLVYINDEGNKMKIACI